jgi:hypothetical protein
MTENGDLPTVILDMVADSLPEEYLILMVWLCAKVVEVGLKDQRLQSSAGADEVKIPACGSWMALTRFCVSAALTGRSWMSQHILPHRAKRTTQCW